MKKKHIVFTIIGLILLYFYGKLLILSYERYQDYEKNVEIIQYACEKSGQEFAEIDSSSYVEEENVYYAELLLYNEDKGEHLSEFLKAFNEYLYSGKEYFFEQ